MHTKSKIISLLWKNCPHLEASQKLVSFYTDILSEIHLAKWEKKSRDLAMSLAMCVRLFSSTWVDDKLRGQERKDTFQVFQRGWKRDTHSLPIHSLQCTQATVEAPWGQNRPDPMYTVQVWEHLKLSELILLPARSELHFLLRREEKPGILVFGQQLTPDLEGAMAVG